MPSLKDMRARMNSVRQTRKITSAMKLVAASKLRRAQDQAEASRPFALRMTEMLQNLAAGVAGLPDAPPLLAGTGKDEVHLLIVATADRGLCGGFNSTIVRGARRRIQELLGRQAGQADHHRQEGPRPAAPRPARPDPGVLRRHRRQAADRVCRRAARNRARARAVRGWRVRRLHADLQQVQVGGDADPHLPAAGAGPGRSCGRGRGETSESGALYEFEPDEERILGELLPRNLAVQLFGALLENAASEQGARMAAMDNATRNAGDMINKLAISYNRQRQAQITKELMEIISGAEAL